MPNARTPLLGHIACISSYDNKTVGGRKSPCKVRVSRFMDLYAYTGEAARWKAEETLWVKGHNERKAAPL